VTICRLVVIHLPFGPTACFKLTSEKLGYQIKGSGAATGHIPEIILNNFHTRLGHRVGRLLGSLFPHQPEFVGRNVVTFHNQRDFVFVRRHRYIFTEDGKKARLQELGPRFTLKMRWLLADTFNTTQGEYEWYFKRHRMEDSKKRFFL
jgi:ribosome production factor 1